MNLTGNVSTLISRAGQDGSFIKFFVQLTDKSNVTTMPTLDWYSNYHNNLWTIYKQEIGADTTIQLDSGKEFKITGALLMAQSPVFQAMFKTDYTEGKSKTVVIKDIEDEHMEAFIKWLYIGEAHLSKLSQELFVISDRYQVSSLKEQCVHYMTKDIYSENVIQYLIFGFDYNNEDLKKAAIEFIQKMPNSEVVELLSQTSGNDLHQNTNQTFEKLKN
ncbi:KBTBD4 isoform 7 [Aphelenchoides bicaudatus]|nr:KBTBD4 isoform 7 [Aphelenchoides bicaudatus]